VQYIYNKNIMKRTIRLSENDLSNLIKRIVREQDEFDLKKTVMDTTGFEEEDIPQECLGNNPGMSRIEMIQGCITKITDKSTALNNAIKALSDSLNKAKSEAGSIQTESRRRMFREQDEMSKLTPEQMLDKRGKEMFLSSLENLIYIFKQDNPRYSSWNKNYTFYDDILPKFKERLDTLFYETEAARPDQ